MTPQESTRERFEKEFKPSHLCCNGDFCSTDDHRETLKDLLSFIESECTLREERGRREGIKVALDRVGVAKVGILGTVKTPQDIETVLKIVVDTARRSLLGHPEDLTDKKKEI